MEDIFPSRKNWNVTGLGCVFIGKRTLKAAWMSQL
jgi:hypothetical protein